MKNLVFKISLLDKISAPLRKVKTSFDAAKKAADKTNTSIKKLPNSINQLETKLSGLRNRQKSAFSIGQIKKYEKHIRKTERELNRLNKRAGITKNKLGGMFVGGAAVYGAFRIGSDVIKSWDMQKQAEAQVQQGLITTKNASGRTFDQLKKQASFLQKNSLYGDENILQNVTAQILTFTNITGKAFDRTQQASLDLAARLKIDTKSAAIMLGKALNDPVKNLSALSRSGIQFSDEQTNLIKSLAETGHQAEAQSLILDELQKQYGGSAKAAAMAGAGPLKQLAMRFGDIKEKVGALLFKVLNKLTPFLDNLIIKLEKTVEWVTKNAKAIGTVIAVVGSAILVFKAVTMVMKAYTAVQWLLNAAMLANPIGLIIVGVAALIGLFVLAWKKSEKFRATILGLWEAVKSFAVLLKDVFMNSIKSMLSGIGKLGQALWAFFKGDYKKAFQFAKEGAVDLVKGSGTYAAYNLVKNKNVITDAYKTGYNNSFKPKLQQNKSKSNNFLSSITPNGSGSGGNILAGGSGSNLLGDSGGNVDAITGGGSKPTNITVNLGKFFDNLNINSTNLDEGINEMQSKVEDALLRVLNSANAISNG